MSTAESSTLLDRLATQTMRCYHDSGRFTQGFARGKLRGDPLYATLLQGGLLAHRQRIVDLGCGQGLLAAWLLQAHACYVRAPQDWPPGWPPPAPLHSYLGIDINAAEVRRGTRALAALLPAARLVHADIRSADYGTADAVVIVDALHYLDRAAQRRVVERVRTALPDGGALLLRVGDAGAGTRFAIGQMLDRSVALLRRGRWLRLHCRGAAEWQSLLRECGFAARRMAMSTGAAFRNVLFLAQAA